MVSERLETLEERDDDFRSKSLEAYKDDVNDVDEQTEIVSDPFFIGDR